MVNECLCPRWQATSSVSSAEEHNYQVGFVDFRWKKITITTKRICRTLWILSYCANSPLRVVAHLVVGSRGPRLATKKYSQTTALLTHSAMAAGTANWVRSFPFCCESQRRKQSRLL